MVLSIIDGSLEGDGNFHEIGSIIQRDKTDTLTV